MAKDRNPLFDLLRNARHEYQPAEIAKLFGSVEKKRVEALATRLGDYIATNLPASFEGRNGLAAYRSNPYVLMTSASVLRLDDPRRFADFLFNTKLYMGLETSFGKSIESAFVEKYPINSEAKWLDPPEKIKEAEKLKGLSREEKAKRRIDSVWREIDKSCVIANRRYLTSIKSGPNCINDTQVDGMTRAIAANHKTWIQQTRATYRSVRELDVIIGLTYGTDRTTNNKENQILVKLLERGFTEENRNLNPGVLIDSATRTVRVYRRIGRDFWSLIGNPQKPDAAQFVFLEILLALVRAVSTGIQAADLQTRINLRLKALSQALAELQFPAKNLPTWIQKHFTDRDLFLFATAMTAFYDEGI